MLGGFTSLIDQLGDMQQRLGRNAATIQTDTAGLGSLVDKCHLKPMIGRLKGRGISTRTTTQH
jgi:hypothetical protein